MYKLSCYTVVLGKPAGQNIGIIRQGESGYWATTYDFGEGDSAANAVRALNESKGIDADIQLALELGSMFSFNIPACDILKECA